MVTLDAHLLAMDRRTGAVLWDVVLADYRVGYSATLAPLIVKDKVIVGISGGEYTTRGFIDAYDPQTGKILWSIAGLGPLVYTDPLLGTTMGVSMSGFHGPAIGFKLGGSGDLTELNRLWVQSKSNPQRIGSGALVGSHVFMANENCTLQCLDVATGDEKWRERLGTGGRTWGSLLVAEGRLYITNANSVTYVVAANPDKYELLATNSLNEPTNSTPAFSNGQIFLRTFKHLYCIGK